MKGRLHFIENDLLAGWLDWDVFDHWRFLWSTVCSEASDLDG